MNTNIIEGNPTKKFFIEMITRDISIEDANNRFVRQFNRRS